MKRNLDFRDERTILRPARGASHPSARAFTLVELLVVIAITSILLGLLFGPIISSFNLTRRARAISQAQDAARFGLERITRELGRATYIYDNGLAPVAIPMAYDDVAAQNNQTFDVGNPADPLNPAGWPRVAYARIDLAQPAVRQDATDIIDPTTGQPVGGAELRPGVRGKRVTRYFLGLRHPGINPDTGSQWLYQNRYEFQRVDNDNNPVILYRAEYDPTDPNLFDTDPADYSNTAANVGGFNDPAFFYATKASDTAQGANGRPYGVNWQAIAQPVLVSENVDLLRWNRAGAATNRREKDKNDPFTPTTVFAPVAVPSDVAAPGFLTSGGVETPAAVPTLYQTKYGAWSYPYRITVLRGSTNYNSASPRTNPGEPFGALKLTVDRDQFGNISITNTTQRPFESTGTLTTNPAGNLYAVYSPVTRKLFVKTPRLTFSVDPDRGRIETAFPPLMGQISGGNGVPFVQQPAGAAVLASPGLIPVVGEVIPTRFKVDTRSADATRLATHINQGILQANLFASSYQLATAALTDAATMPSPLEVFGEASGAAKLRGVRIIPGSERLSAPVTSGGIESAWTRIGALGSGEQPDAVYDPLTLKFDPVPERRPFYKFEYDFYPDNATDDYVQLFTFDEPGPNAAGMAAADTYGVNFLVATYLWQNNFSRNPDATSASWGHPLSDTGALISEGGATRPEADIFRVDYSTRQQYNINLGARIYDPTDGRAQTIQVTDKVIINNVLR